MLHRSKSPPVSAREHYEVTLQPDQTPEKVYDEWLASICAVTRYCKWHPGTVLELSPNSSGFRLVYDYPYIDKRVAKSSEFCFDAAFVCAGCYVERALCPPEFHETSFDTFDTSVSERKVALAKAREFAIQVSTRGCGFALFVGSPGAGKTRLACNVVRELMFHDALYVRQGELTCALRAAYSRKDVFVHRTRRDDDDEDRGDNDTSPTPLEIAQKVRFLVLDEIGCVALANDERLMIDELLKHRYERRRPTILISNLPLTSTAERPGLKEFLGDVLADRIQEATGNGKFIVQFSGPSYRRSTGENYLQGLG